MRASTKSNPGDDTVPPIEHQEIKIENFDCGSSMSSEPPSNLKKFHKSRNLQIETRENMA